MIVKLLTEHHLELLSLKGACTGSSESTPVKMPHCWKSHVAAQIYVLFCSIFFLQAKSTFSCLISFCVGVGVAVNNQLRTKW